MSEEVPVELFLRYHASRYIAGWDCLNDKGRDEVWAMVADADLSLFELSQVAHDDSRLTDDSFLALAAMNAWPVRDMVSLDCFARSIDYEKDYLVSDLLDLRAHGYFDHVKEIDPELHDFLVRELEKEEVS